MPNDEVGEVRQIRHAISEECGHDVRKVAAYYRQVEQELRESGDFRFEDRSFSSQEVSPTSDVGTAK